jgi:ATP-dependent exoDNAse (exonuclease V) alpha subunit
MQFPVTLAFATTVNKSQGSTLDKCGLIGFDRLFAHGMTYVVVSRVKRPSDLIIFRGSTPTGVLPEYFEVMNVVDRRVFDNI